MDLFEFALQKMLRRHLEPNLKPMLEREIRHHSVNGAAAACPTLLSALAHAGQDPVEEAQAAFGRGVGHLKSGAQFRFLELPLCTLTAIESALDELAEATPQTKKAFLGACVQTVAADGTVRPREFELLRAIADTIDTAVRTTGFTLVDHLEHFFRDPKSQSCWTVLCSFSRNWSCGHPGDSVLKAYKSRCKNILFDFNNLRISSVDLA